MATPSHMRTIKGLPSTVSTLLLAGVILTGCTLAAHSVRSTRSGLHPAAPAPDEVAVTPDEMDTGWRATRVERPPVRTEEPARLEPLATASPRERAVTILMDSSQSEWAQLRANAFEALISDPVLLRREVLSGIADENRGVRFVATMAIARASLCDLISFVEPLLFDPSDSVRAAAMYALHTCGEDIDPTPLAAMVDSEDPEVRGNAYVVLGLLGNPTATRLIRSSLGTPLGLADPVRMKLVELQGAAALVRLGEVQEIEPIRAALFAPVEQAEITALAIQIISELADKGARQMLARLVEAPSEQARPAEIRLAAAEAIAKLGFREPEPLLRLASEYRHDPRPATRAQTASLLSEVDDATSDAFLAELMVDEDALVRLAAAGSLLLLAVQGDSEEDQPATATAAVH